MKHLAEFGGERVRWSGCGGLCVDAWRYAWLYASAKDYSSSLVISFLLIYMYMQFDIKEFLQEQLRGTLQRIRLEDLVLSLFHFLFLIALAWLLTRVMRSVLKKMEHGIVVRHHSIEEDKRIETLMRLLRQALSIVIWMVAGLMALKEIGIDIAPLLASAGVVGLAIGFGAQNLVKDVISGLFLILENQMRVGDVVQVSGVMGAVERITLRTTTLRDAQGVVHVLPNGSIQHVSNHTFGWSAYVFEIGISYGQDPDRAIAVLKAVGSELAADPVFGPMVIAAIEVWGVERFRESDVAIKGRLRTNAGMHMDVGREFLKRVRLAFEREGIEIPFPQVQVHMPKGSAPAGHN